MEIADGEVNCFQHTYSLIVHLFTFFFSSRPLIQKKVFFNFISMPINKQRQQVLHNKLMLDDKEQFVKLSKLYQTLNDADLKSKTVQQYSIVVLGLTRAGKSTFLNWIFNPGSLIGERKGTNYFFVEKNRSENPENSKMLAQIDSGFTSVTIMANTCQVKEGNLAVTYIDFGGFGERRDAFEVIKVSYVLAAFLLKIKKIKFVLVMTEHAFNDLSSTGFRDTMIQFLNLFDFDLMQESEQNMLFESVSICISLSRKYMEHEILQQLGIIRDDLRKLYEKNNGYFEKYLICQRLLNVIIRKKLIDIFPLAEVGKSPNQSTVISNFNRKNWQYFNLQNFRNSICYPYVKQYHNLKQYQKKYLIQSILIRFDLINNFKRIIQKMTKHLVANLCEESVSYGQDFNQVCEVVRKHSFYKDIPVTFQKRRTVDHLSIVDRMKKVLRLIELGDSIVNLNVWQVQNYWNQQFSQQEQRLANENKIQKYFDFVEQYFSRQMSLMYELFGEDEQNYQILCQMHFVIRKSFNQANIFSNLNKYIVDGNCQVSSVIREKLRNSIYFTNEVVETTLSLKSTFISSLAQKDLSVIDPQQAISITRYILELQQQIAQQDSAQIYWLVYRLQLTASQRYTRNNAMRNQLLNTLIQGLKYIIKHQICLSVLPCEKSEREIQQFQKKYLKKITEIYLNAYPSTRLQSIIRICDQLNLFSIKTYVFERLRQIEPRAVENIRLWAEHERKIGNSENARRLYRQYGFAVNRNFATILQQIRRQALQNILTLQKNRQIQSRPIQAKKLLEQINTIKKELIPGSDPVLINFQLEKSNYIQKNKKLIFKNAFKKNLPINPSNYQLLTQSADLIQLVQGKRVNIVLSSQSQRGQSTFIYALLGNKLMIRNGTNGFYYDKMDGQSGNIFNHTGQNHTQYPYVYPVNQQEVLVDFIPLFHNQSDKKMIAAILLERILKKCFEFRFIFVFKENDIAQSRFQEIIEFLKLLMELLPKQQQQRKQVYGCRIGKLLHLAITFQTDKNACLKGLRVFYDKFISQEFISAMEKKYGISGDEQLICYWILKSASRRVASMKKASDNIERVFLQPDMFSRLTVDGGVESEWEYFNKDRIENHLSQIIPNNMFSSEAKNLQAKIYDKIIHLDEIYKIMHQIIQANYMILAKDAIQIQHIQESFESARELLPKRSRVFQENFRPQDLSNKQKLLKSIRYLLQIKYFFKCRQYVQWFYPQNYPQFFQMMGQYSQLLFTHIKLNCCSNTEEYQIAINSYFLSKQLLSQLQAYSLCVGNCQIQSLRQKMNFVRSVQQKLEGKMGGNYFDELNHTFFNQIQLQDLRNPSKESQESNLRDYERTIQLLQTYWKDENVKGVSHQSLIRMQVDLLKVQVRLYIEMKYHVQQVNARIKIIKILCSGQLNLSNQRTIYQQVTEDLEESIEQLNKIALSLAGTKPRMSLKICDFLSNNETAEKVLQIMQSREDVLANKIKYLSQRINLWVKMGKRTKARQLHRLLMSYATAGNPLYQHINTLEGACQYAQNNRWQSGQACLNLSQQSINKFVRRYQVQMNS